MNNLGRGGRRALHRRGDDPPRRRAALGACLPADGPTDERPTRLLATAYRVVISVAGAWLTARLAPAKPMTHAMILGYVGVVLGLAGLAATWNAGLGPRWYPVALVILAIPQCWAGGKIYEAMSGTR
jgi:hypothetical protein